MHSFQKILEKDMKKGRLNKKKTFGKSGNIYYYLEFTRFRKVEVTKVTLHFSTREEQELFLNFFYKYFSQSNN